MSIYSSYRLSQTKCVYIFASLSFSYICLSITFMLNMGFWVENNLTKRFSLINCEWILQLHGWPQSNFAVIRRTITTIKKAKEKTCRSGMVWHFAWAMRAYAIKLHTICQELLMIFTESTAWHCYPHSHTLHWHCFHFRKP